jgi:HAD superfamily hydrolase (TIGR01549 family)
VIDLSTIDWIFFDIDGTLWNHDLAITEALRATAAELDLLLEDVEREYHVANQFLWDEMVAGRITFDIVRVKRFEMLLQELAPRRVREAERLGEEYIRRYLATPRVLPGARAVVAAAARTHPLAILTNGFHPTQDPKLAHLSPVDVHFRFMQCPEDAGGFKTDPIFWQAAMRRAGITDPRRALIVGDTWHEDILPARAAGWQTLWLSHGRPIPGPREDTVVLRDVADWLTTFPDVAEPAVEYRLAED